MGSPSFPHLLSPSKAGQVIYKTKKKIAKKKTGLSAAAPSVTIAASSGMWQIRMYACMYVCLHVYVYLIITFLWS
jgi:hypothetical protein